MQRMVMFFHTTTFNVIRVFSFFYQIQFSLVQTRLQSFYVYNNSFNTSLGFTFYCNFG